MFMGFIKSILRNIFSFIKKTPALRNMFYDLKNIDEFGNLHEHEKMIADDVRVGTYYTAIGKHIKRGDVVIDLGTGSGILSIFAARQNAKRVYAIDHSEFIEVAKKTAEVNGVNNITFVNANSHAFMAPEKADILLHEQLGDDLFNENMLENLFDLKKRCLKETGRILPGKFELYLEPASLRPAYRVPFIWEKEVYGVDFSFLKSNELAEKYIPASYNFSSIGEASIDHFLCTPEPILTFDMNKMESADELPTVFKCIRKVAQPGELHGVCMFFRVIFDESTSFDTSPVHTHTHWGNGFYRFASKNYVVGDELTLTLTMENLIQAKSWSVQIA